MTSSRGSRSPVRRATPRRARQPRAQPHPRRDGSDAPLRAGRTARRPDLEAAGPGRPALRRRLGGRRLPERRRRRELGGAAWRLDQHPDRERWLPGFGGLCAHSLLVDARHPERIWVGISAAGALRSDDGGESFTNVDSGVSAGGEGHCVHALAHDPLDADVLYRQDHRGVYRSRSGGDHWECIENGLPRSPLSDDHLCSFGFPIVFDPRSRSAFVVPMESDAYRFPHEGRLAVYRTRDGGDSWQGMRTGLPEHCHANVLRQALAVDAREPCGVYLGTTSGSLYASADGGETSRRLAADLPKILCVEAFGD